MTWRLLLSSIVLTLLAAVAGTLLGESWHSHRIDTHDAVVRTDARKVWESELAAAVADAERKAKASTQTAINQANTAGRARETKRQAIDTFFTRLDQEATHDTPDVVDACVLPAERLQRWTDANTGQVDPDTPAASGAATRQFDDTAPGTAGTGLRSDARTGGEPSGRGAGLSPPRESAVRFAGVAEAAGDARLPTLAPALND